MNATQTTTANLSRHNALIVRLTGEDKDTVTCALLLRRDRLEEMLSSADAHAAAGIRESIARVNHALASVREYL